MYFCDEPILGAEQGFLLYLANMGQNEQEHNIIRPQGYFKPQIIYCTSGSGILEFDDKSIKIEPNMGFYLPENYPHRYYPTKENWDTHWVAFGGAGSDDFMKTIGFSEPSVFKINDLERIERAFDKMHRALAKDDIFGNYKASALLYDFIIELYCDISSKKLSGIMSKAVERAVDYINLNYKEGIALDTIAEYSGITKQHLCRLFKKNFNCTVVDYITKRKLKEAKNLLRDTTLPIETIAERTGFCSSGYFAQMFRRFEDTTPGEYRRERRSTY